MLEDLLLDEAIWVPRARMLIVTSMPGNTQVAASIAASGLVKSVKRVDTTGAEFEAARTELASLTGTPPLATLANRTSRSLDFFEPGLCCCSCHNPP
jgi:hypothetical protein